MSLFDDNDGGMMKIQPRNGRSIVQAERGPAHPALRYRGGKWRIARWIVEQFPPHECYVEPFAGAASVLLHKAPASLECLNDLDGDVVAFWRVLRERPHEFIGRILTTPFSRRELALACEPLQDLKGREEDDMERARRLWVRCYQGRGSSSRKSGWRFQPTNVFPSGQTWRQDHAKAARRIHGLVDIAARLQNVQIDNCDVLECIGRWDRPGTLFYLDPPYADGREHSPKLYAHEMDTAAHEALAEALHGVRGMAVVSGYPGLYDQLYQGWERLERGTSGERQKPTIEVLWLNPATLDAWRAANAQGELLEAIP